MPDPTPSYCPGCGAIDGAGHLPGCPVLADQTAARRIPPTPVPIPTDLYTVPDAAALAGVHERTVRSWFNRGLVAYYGHSGAYRVSLAELLPVTRRAPAGSRPHPHPNRKRPPVHRKPRTSQRRRLPAPPASR